MKSKFGDVENPLLVSVRSGARASMPGMMDTILNLGLNDEVVEGYHPQDRSCLVLHGTLIVVLSKCMVTWFWA